MAERNLIRKCAANASAVRGKEWFDGLDFKEVIAWLDEAAAVAEVAEPKQPHPLAWSSYCAPLIDFLQTLTGPEAVEFGARAGVPAGTTLKIKYGQVTDPRISTIEKLRRRFLSETKAS